ncbi:MAG: CRISPR-associated endonuclease Cas1 [Myxococcales bacterium]|nr:CRISPR-associated endonuclease Cas1 [Myxococcales bacterium]
MKKAIYVTHPAAKIYRADGMIAANIDKQRVDRWALDDVERVLLFGSAQITTTAVHLLLKHRIPLFLLSRSGRLRGQIVAPEEGNIFLRMAQHARFGDMEFRLEFARSIVAKKIRGDVEIVMRYMRNHPDTAEMLSPKVERMRQMVGCLDSAANSTTLMGLEGAAASAWFEAFHIMVKPPFLFERRSKHPAHNEVNALLNLGFTLLALEVESRLETAGLDPRIGYYHGIRYGRSSLALDMMEPHRPAVSRMVLSVLNRRMVSLNDFEKTDAGVRMNKETLHRFVGVFEASMGDVVPQGKSVREQLHNELTELRRKIMEPSLPDEEMDPPWGDTQAAQAEPPC